MPFLSRLYIFDLTVHVSSAYTHCAWEPSEQLNQFLERSLPACLEEASDLAQRKGCDWRPGRLTDVIVCERSVEREGGDCGCVLSGHRG